MRLGELLAALGPDPRVAEAALAEILHAAAELAAAQDHADPVTEEQ